MKIERINENQIRCTLTSDDLKSRELKLSELAFGSEKAKLLFHDMMQQAALECGFEAENIPLMIEAIPSSDSIVLVITKVSNPEELDHSLSKSDDSNFLRGDSLENLEGAEEFLDFLSKLRENVKAHSTNHVEQEESTVSAIRLFSFSTMDGVITACKFLNTMYQGVSTLYKDPVENIYILAISAGEYSSADFNKICNMFTEYASLEKADGMTLAFLEEHCTVMISQNAVEKLAAF